MAAKGVDVVKTKAENRGPETAVAWLRYWQFYWPLALMSLAMGWLNAPMAAFLLGLGFLVEALAMEAVTRFMDPRRPAL